jgi:hypothetical protein
VSPGEYTDEHGQEPAAPCARCADAAAYVLGALEEQEVAPFREHLAGCAVCRAEVTQLQVVADSLGLGVPGRIAPETLRARIMATAHAEAELLRAAGHDADKPIPAARSRWRRGLVPALGAAAALGVGLLVGALAINTGSTTHTQIIRAVVVEPGHNASAELRKVGSHLELVVEGMPAPPHGQIYEVWLERGTQAPAPTDALFSVTSSGEGSVDVPGYVQGVSHVLVTAEPLGGTLKPTHNPVIIAST